MELGVCQQPVASFVETSNKLIHKWRGSGSGVIDN
jgi:hypothetical protein